MNAHVPEIINTMKTIAVVGLSTNPKSDSYDIANYLLRYGYSIFPVNPTIKHWMGITSYPDLFAVPVPIDVVDIFRRSEFVPEIVDQAIKVKAKTIWMQLGIIHEEAAKKAEDAGLWVVMDRCISVDHQRYAGVIR